MVIKYLSCQLPLAKKRNQSPRVDAPDVGRTTISKVAGIVPAKACCLGRPDPDARGGGFRLASRTVLILHDMVIAYFVNNHKLDPYFVARSPLSAV